LPSEIAVTGGTASKLLDMQAGYERARTILTHTLTVPDIALGLPGGIYSGEKHALEHFRERWMSRLSDIDSFETWQKKEAKSIGEVAREKVKEILATHKPEPIPEDAQKEISKIMKRAEAELL